MAMSALRLPSGMNPAADVTVTRVCYATMQLADPNVFGLSSHRERSATGLQDA